MPLTALVAYVASCIRSIEKKVYPQNPRHSRGLRRAPAHLIIKQDPTGPLRVSLVADSISFDVYRFDRRFPPARLPRDICHEARRWRRAWVAA